jgi:hypothetical protein
MVYLRRRSYGRTGSSPAIFGDADAPPRDELVAAFLLSLRPNLSGEKYVKNDEADEKSARWVSRKEAIAIGVFACALWALVSGPVFRLAGRVLDDTAYSFVDSAYRIAALDPSTSLFRPYAVFLSNIPLYGAEILIVWLIIDWRLSRKLSSVEGPENRRAAAVEFVAKFDRLKRGKKALQWTLAVLLLAMAAILFWHDLVTQQAIDIWRQFHADLTICAPSLTHDEEKAFLARFAGVQSRDDFRPIQKELEAIAAKHSLRLCGLKHW